MRLSRPNDTAALVGVCERQLREWEATGHFPQRFALHPEGRAKAHDLDEVDQWIEARKASRVAA